MLLLTLIAAAHAADLDLTVAQTGLAPVALTYHEVQPGPQPTLLLRDGTMRMDVDVQPVDLTGCTGDCQPQVRLAVRLSEVHGRRQKVVSTPTVVAFVGEPATVSMAKREPVVGADGAVTFTEQRLDIDLLYSGS